MTKPFKLFLPIAITLLLMMTHISFARQLSDVAIETFDGRQVVGTLDSISDQGKLVGKGIPTGTNIGDILTIENRVPSTSPRRKVEILLGNGGKVFASEFTTDGQDASLIAKSVVGKFPLESMTAVIWRNERKVQTALKNRSEEFDQVIVQSGEDQVIVSGLLERVTEEKVELNYKGKSRKISRSIVLAIITADLQPQPPTKTVGTFEMVDGSTVIGGIASFQDGVISVMLDNRNSIKLDAGLLGRVVIKSDRIAFVSEITPLEVDQRAYFGIERPWQRNKSIEGNPLTLHSTTSEKPLVFTRGMGTQSYSRLVYEVPANFDRFTATVGIDAETNGKGDCDVIVQADGIQVWQGRVKADDDPKNIDVDIDGARQVSLIVQPGKQYDLSDHLNWCNAKFLNTK